MAGLVIGVMCLFAAIVCFAIGCVYAKKARNGTDEDWDCKAISVTMRTISAISAKSEIKENTKNNIVKRLKENAKLNLQSNVW